jgi:hypothetical protein
MFSAALASQLRDQRRIDAAETVGVVLVSGLVHAGEIDAGEKTAALAEANAALPPQRDAKH